MERASICISLHVCTTCIPYAYHMHEPPRVYHIPAATAQWLRGGCTGDDLLVRAQWLRGGYTGDDLLVRAQWLRGGCTGDDLLVRAQWLRGGCTGDDLLVRATPPPMETILSPPSTYLLTSLPTYTVHTRRQATAARTPNTPSHPVTQSRTAPHIARRRSQQRCYLASTVRLHVRARIRGTLYMLACLVTYTCLLIACFVRESSCCAAVLSCWCRMCSSVTYCYLL